MERAPYVYQLVAVLDKPRPHKSVLKTLPVEDGCEWNETVLHQSEDQSEMNDCFTVAVENQNKRVKGATQLAGADICGLYLRRLGYPGRFQEWRREWAPDLERTAGLPDTERSAQPRASVKGKERSVP